MSRSPVAAVLTSSAWRLMITIAISAHCTGLIAFNDPEVEAGIIKKTFHIHNPGPNTADEVEMVFTGTVQEIKDAGGADNKGFKPKVNDSNARIVTLAGGSFVKCQNIDYDVTANMPEQEVLPGRNLKPVVNLELKAGLTFKLRGQEVNSQQDRKNKRKHVAGFTNYESFYYTDPNNAEFIIQNPFPEDRIHYVLSDLSVFTNLPVADFSIDAIRNLSGLVPIFSVPEVILLPGFELRIPIGQVRGGTFALATVGNIRVTDLDEGDFVDFSVPQFYAEAFIPEPTAAVLAIAGIACLTPFFRRRI
jgi:hypothetical protein